MTQIDLDNINEFLKRMADRHFEHFGELKKAKYHTRQPCTIWLKYVRTHVPDSEKHVHLENCRRCSEQEFSCAVCYGRLNESDALTTDCPGWKYDEWADRLISANQLDFVDGGWEISAQGTARRMADYTTNRLDELYGSNKYRIRRSEVPEVPF